MKKPLFETEAALCAAFIAWVKDEAGKLNHGRETPTWEAYAETAGWDILLVGADGTQIGIQAKQRFNLKVLSQCLPGCWDAWHDEGPDYRAVLVPDRDDGYGDLCAALGLTLFAPSGARYGDSDKMVQHFSPGLSMEHWNGGWHYWSPRKRCALPEFVPDVVAGASGPVQLTKWKIAALRIVATLEVQGYVTRNDFKTYSVDPRRWTGPNGWLISSGFAGRFVRGPSLDFDTQHPTVYAQVLAEVKAKWIDAERAAQGLFAEVS